MWTWRWRRPNNACDVVLVISRCFGRLGIARRCAGGDRQWEWSLCCLLRHCRPCGSVLWNLLFRPDAGGVVCTVGHYQRRRIQGGTLAYGPKSGGGYVRDLGQRGSDSMSGPQPTVWEWNAAFQVPGNVGVERSSDAGRCMKPAITVVIPTYNRLDLTKRAVESVLAQSVPVSEVIVIDDGSFDGTSELLRRHSAENSAWRGRVRYGAQKTRGLGQLAIMALLWREGNGWRS